MFFSCIRGDDETSIESSVSTTESVNNHEKFMIEASKYIEDENVRSLAMPIDSEDLKLWFEVVSFKKSWQNKVLLNNALIAEKEAAVTEKTSMIAVNNAMIAAKFQEQWTTVFLVLTFCGSMMTSAFYFGAHRQNAFADLSKKLSELLGQFSKIQVAVSSLSSSLSRAFSSIGSIVAKSFIATVVVGNK